MQAWRAGGGDLLDIVELGRVAFNAKHLDGFMEWYAEECELIVPGMPRSIGKPTVRAFWETFMRVFPDERFETPRVYPHGDSVVYEWIDEGTQMNSVLLPSGDVLPASGKPWRFFGVDVLDFDRKGVRRHRCYWDWAEWITQLNAEFLGTVSWAKWPQPEPASVP